VFAIIGDDLILYLNDQKD
jgi:hypothetical protein